VIRKELDKSSPRLRQAYQNGEAFTTWRLDLWEFSPTAGSDVLYATINLKNARISGVRTVLPNTRDAESKALGAYEEVSFKYDSVEYTHAEGTLTSVMTASP
jgi:type VI secretion system secreted protein Hcp